MGYAVGVPLAVLSLLVGLAFIYAGRRLHRAGSGAEREAREQALYALATNRGGLLTALDGARALNLNVADVEAILNELAKRDPEHVSLEIDDEGAMFYAFSRPGDRRDTFGKRYRVEPEGQRARARLPRARRHRKRSRKPPAPAKLAVRVTVKACSPAMSRGSMGRGGHRLRPGCREYQQMR